MRFAVSTLILAVALAPVMPMAGASDSGPCPEKGFTIGQFERHTVAVHSDCTVDAVTNEGIICLGGAVGRSDTQAGPIHWTSYYCESPYEVNPVETTGTDVFLPPLMGCTWSGSYKPYAQAGPVTVWMYTCDPET